MPTELEIAYAHCQRTAKEQAKNFYYAFRTLPARKRLAIYAVYAFCRYCDDIADDLMPLEDKENRLADTRQLLRQSMKNQSLNPVFTALNDASSKFGIPTDYFGDVIDGVEMDLTWTRFKDFKQLRAYCHKVASVVGLICIEIFGYKDLRAQEYALDLGLAMQITNIIRDIKEDCQRGRIYIPLDEMERFGYSEQDLMKGVVNSSFLNLMEFQASRARQYFAKGKRLIPLLSPESRVCTASLHNVYSSILDRIESSGFDVFERRISLSMSEKLFITAKLWVGNLKPTILLPRK